MTKPELRAPSDELIALLSRFDLKVGELALELRDVLLKEAPAANERILDVYVLALLYFGSMVAGLLSHQRPQRSREPWFQPLRGA